MYYHHRVFGHQKRCLRQTRGYVSGHQISTSTSTKVSTQEALHSDNSKVVETHVVCTNHQGKHHSQSLILQSRLLGSSTEGAYHMGKIQNTNTLIQHSKTQQNYSPWLWDSSNKLSITCWSTVPLLHIHMKHITIHTKQKKKEEDIRLNYL